MARRGVGARRCDHALPPRLAVRIIGGSLHAPGRRAQLATDQRSRMLQQAAVLIVPFVQAPAAIEAKQGDLRSEPDASGPVERALAELLNEGSAIGVRENLL